MEKIPPIESLSIDAQPSSYLAVATKSGEVRYTMDVTSDMPITSTDPDLDLIAAPADLDRTALSRLIWNGQQFVRRPLQTTAHDSWVFEASHPEGGTWKDLRPLTEVQATQWNKIKKHRFSIESGGFEVERIGRFDSDRDSQLRITAAASAAQQAMQAMQTDLRMEWTLQDNRNVLLDAASLLNVASSLAAHMDAAHQRGRRLRRMIEAATTKAEVEAIVWETTHDMV